MLSLQEILLRLTVAAALGAVIGVERDLRRRPAGIRTSLFVCLATALFTILSGEIAPLLGDTGSTRIASNIVQGGNDPCRSGDRDGRGRGSLWRRRLFDGSGALWADCNRVGSRSSQLEA